MSDAPPATLESFDPSRPTAVCEHLHANPDVYVAWLTGRGIEQRWACPACAKAYPTEPEWRRVDDPWWDANERECFEEGVVGAPEVFSRASHLRFTHEAVPLSLRAEVLDFQPCEEDPAGCWFLLADGYMRRVDLGRGAVTRLLRLPALHLASGGGRALAVSPIEDFAVIYEPAGQRGAVIDLSTGRVVRPLDRGKYHVEHSWFPVAFARRRGRTLLLAASAWNRLDLYDLTESRILSERAEGPGEREWPKRSIDYFFGRLLLSPDGARVVDDGWVWHPTGIPRAWNLDAWIDNPWEPEDGPTLAKGIAYRQYFWNGEMCFVDETTVALWGWGGDDDYLVPAAVLYDVRDGRLVRWFAGPQVRRAANVTTRSREESMVFDEFLFAVHEEVGTTVWDVETGERLHTDESLRPTRYHRAGRCFLTLTADGVRVSRLVRDVPL